MNTIYLGERDTKIVFCMWDTMIFPNLKMFKRLISVAVLKLNEIEAS